MPRISNEEKARRNREPFGVRRDRLKVTFKNPNDFREPTLDNPTAGRWHAVWLNDDQYGTISDALAHDYQHVTKDEVVGFGAEDVGQTTGGVDSYVSIVDRTGMRIFLMKIERSLYEEDEAMRQAENEAPFIALKEKRDVKDNLKQYAGKNFSIREETGRRR